MTTPNRSRRPGGFLLPLAATAAAGLVSLGVYYYFSTSIPSTTTNNPHSSSTQRSKDKPSPRMPDPGKRNIAVVIRDDADGLELLRRLPQELPMEWVNVFILVFEEGKGGRVMRQAVKMLPRECPREMVLPLADLRSVDAMLKQIAPETVMVQGGLAGGVKGVVEGGWVGGVVLVGGEEGLEKEVKTWKTKKVVVKGLEQVEAEWRERVR